MHILHNEMCHQGRFASDECLVRRECYHHYGKQYYHRRSMAVRERSAPHRTSCVPAAGGRLSPLLQGKGRSRLLCVRQRLPRHADHDPRKAGTHNAGNHQRAIPSGILRCISKTRIFV